MQPMSDLAVPTRALVLAMVEADGTLPLESLRQTAAAVGVSDEQLRLCLRRLVAEDSLRRTGGRGRNASYRAAGNAQARILPETSFFTFALRRDVGEETWDRRWRLVAFAIPESVRRRRDELRRRLIFLGGAPIQGGLYVSPNPWEGYVDAVARELEVEDWLTVATTPDLEIGGESSAERIVERLWPLDAVASGWRSFEMATQRRLSMQSTSPADAAGRAIATLVDVVQAIEPDPLLPPELLPDAWPGPAGRRLFLDAAALFAQEAGEHLPGGIRKLLEDAASVDATESPGTASRSETLIGGALDRHGRQKRHWCQ
jgi:phenylacetic acid degradation operon negative regulatory protein